MKKDMKSFLAKNAIYIFLVILVIIIGLINTSFFKVGNLTNVLIIASVRVIIALGVGGILITKGTDLSAGRSVGLTACIAASLMQRPDYADKMFANLPNVPIIFAFAAAIAVGMIIGLINGSVVSFLKVPPFIATLGMMVVIYGTSSIYTKAKPIGGLKDSFTNVATGKNFIVPNLILISLVIIILIWFLLNKTVFGKNVYAIGGNPVAAEVSGVKVEKNLLKVYILAGALYGLAGTLLAARTGGATNNYGSMYELDAIAAATIGGVSTSGGIGRVSGIITGVLIFEVLNNGLVILGMDANVQQIAKGMIIIAAVAIDIRKYLAKK